jgi:pyrroline-5-carboxylate reductase
MDDYTTQERLAICTIDGGLSLEDAEAIAAQQALGTKAEAPEAWHQANKRWRALVASVYTDTSKAHQALKAKHGVSSFNQLTVQQINDSISRIAEYKERKK